MSSVGARFVELESEVRQVNSAPLSKVPATQEPPPLQASIYKAQVS